MISGLLSNALAEEAGAAKLEAWLADEAPDGPSDDVRELAELLESYLKGVPSALDTLTAMARERPYGRSVAFAAGQVLLYLLDEDDLFREADFGALGLLDDAYLIYACLEALRFAFPDLNVPAAYTPPDGRSPSGRAVAPSCRRRRRPGSNLREPRAGGRGGSVLRRWARGRPLQSHLDRTSVLATRSPLLSPDAVDSAGVRAR